MFIRAIFHDIKRRLEADTPLIQMLCGPRQVGKTTLVKQVLDAIEFPALYVSADGPGSQTSTWLEQQWMRARLLCEQQQGPCLLVIDEVQKIPDWSEWVKKYWDEDRYHQLDLRIVLLGSAPLLLPRGLSESLAGRFESLAIGHWQFDEMREAFGFTLEQYIYFGGYPGAAVFIEDESRWRQYVLDALLEPAIAKDILLMERIHKPALLRQLFHLGCDYSGQILSYQKVLGQLDDAGNTTTLSHYLHLLEGAGLLLGLEKFSLQKYKQRSSSPKFQVFNTALITAQSAQAFQDYRQDFSSWGRLVESAVGASLLNRALGTQVRCYYWRDRGFEVDYVLQYGEQLLAIEVKSGRAKKAMQGLSAFTKAFPKAKVLQIGGRDGMPLESFFSTPIQALFN